MNRRRTSTMTPLTRLAALATALGAGACTGSPEDISVESSTAAIQSGDLAPVPSKRTGVQQAVVHLGGCTGTLIGQHWVITAMHCTVDNGVFGGGTVTIDGDSTTYSVDKSTQYVYWAGNGTDVALWRITPDVPATRTVAKLFTGNDSDVVGKSVTTYGYGAKDCKTGACKTTAAGTTPPCPAGYYCDSRSGDCLLPSSDLLMASFTVDHITANREMNGNSFFDGKYLVVPKNSKGQYILPGDSGGPTFLSSNGQLVGITGGGDDRTYAKVFRDWVAGILGDEIDGVLHPEYPLQFDQNSNQITTRQANWDSGKLIAECGSQHAMAGMTVDPRTTEPGSNPPKARSPGAHQVLCTYNGMQVGPSSSTVIDYASLDARRDTSTGDWDSGYHKGECASNEVMTGISQTSDLKLQKALCSVVSNAPATFHQCAKVPLDGSTVGSTSDDWATYEILYGFAFTKAQCPLNAFMKGVSADPTTGKPHAILCCYDFHPTVDNIFFGDVTGDTPQKADLVRVRPDSVQVQASNGSTFGVARTWISGQYKGSSGNFFADVTGDGKQDAIVVNDFGITIRRSQGTYFSGNEAWTSSVFKGEVGTFFADVTGAGSKADGKADAIAVNNSGVQVRAANGTTFDAAKTWISGAYTGKYGIFFADVTGDKMADAIVVNDFGVTVRRSDGTRFLPNDPNWIDGPYLGKYGIFFADVTGDGKADAIVVNDFGVTVRRSDGTKFLPNDPNWIDGPYLGKYGIFFADVTGDGKADAIVVNDFGITIRRSDGTRFLPNEAWNPGI